jgi:HTH-type transcriptional regulator/antitoxin HigA
MNTRPIRTEADYRGALGEISALMNSGPAPGTPDGDKLDIIVNQVQAYESRHHPIEASWPMQG